MKPTLIKISISQDGLLPQQSIEMGEVLLQNFPRKLMTALDFEKVEDDRKRTTFIGILPVFVVLEEKAQEIEMELTVAHPELRDKVVDIFTSKPPADAKSKPAVNKAVSQSPKPSTAKASAEGKPKPASSAAKKSAGKPVAKERKRSSATERKKAEPKPASPARKKGAKKAVKKQVKPLSNKRPSAAGRSVPKGKGKK